MLLLHRDDDSMAVPEILSYLVPLRQEGLVKAWGVSNWRPARVEELALAAQACGEKVAMNSPQVSLATPTQPMYEGTTHWDAAAAEVARRHRIPTLRWSALAGGYLVTGSRDALWASEENEARRDRLQEISRRTGLSMAAWAVRYALNVAEHVVIGTAQTEHLVELVRGAQPCSAEVARWLRVGGEPPVMKQ